MEAVVEGLKEAIETREGEIKEVKVEKEVLGHEIVTVAGERDLLRERIDLLEVVEEINVSFQKVVQQEPVTVKKVFSLSLLTDLFESIEKIVGNPEENKGNGVAKILWSLICQLEASKIESGILWSLMMEAKKDVIDQITRWDNGIWEGVKDKVNDLVKEQEKSEEWAKESWLFSVHGNFSRHMRVLRKMMGMKYCQKVGVRMPSGKGEHFKIRVCS
jgi:hypothetical protein